MPNFDRIARPYRFLEYLTLGPLLQRTRTHFLPRLKDRRHALILGDGDGRFTAQLLLQNPELTAEVVDISPAMLQLLRKRTTTPRLRTHQADALTHIPTHTPDLVVTHFFLDCLTQTELNQLTQRLAPTLAPKALWLVSDFRIPAGPLSLPARIYIRSLYLAFRLLTGLRVTRLPDHHAALRSAGFTPLAHHHRLFGLLTTELWCLSPSSANPARTSALEQSMSAQASSLPFPDPITSPLSPNLPGPASDPNPVSPTLPGPDPLPDPEPISPSLSDPDPGVFHHDPRRS